MDSSFVALESPNSPMHIGNLLIYNPASAPGGFVRFKDILEFFRSRLQLSKTMRQRLVRVPFDLDYPYWIEDPDFDLEYHLRHVALPKPGDWRQLCIQTARIHARPLDLNRPPWEFTVVEGLDNVPGYPPGCFAFVTKVHHAAIDGMSGIDLMEAIHTLTPDAPPPSKPDSWKPEKVPGPVELLGKSYVNALVNPLKQARVAAQAVPGVANAIKGLITRDFKLTSDYVPPRTRFNTSISPHRVVEGQRFPLEDMKAIRALAPDLKTKVNDVALAIIGGALHKYLTAKDDLPKATMTAMAPISVRSADEKSDMGNQVAAMIAPLGTHTADPGERLAFVFARTSNSKAITNAIGARTMTEVSKVNPLLYMALGAQLFNRVSIAHSVAMPFNTVVTNVPGPPIPIYSAGAKLESMALSLICLTDGLALAHVVQSYCDEAYISFTACRDIMPDPEFYSQCLRESFEEMVTAAKGTAPQKPAAKGAGTDKSATRKASQTRQTAKKPSSARKSSATKAPRKAANRNASKAVSKTAPKPGKRKPTKASAARIAEESK
ncbi:wax ester/triacylglycerol synthase family O-acyltransferase [Erythrobacter sp. SCSIO 43205]|uniref:wax ester/triacylglycerol synthase family O-acyltransferase n=1 Tax=Erythrobacter sp. SCSIO 43205 TaxID=2779361 RepID=UPI001CAA2CB5|nr:wax ester/triacylglycerol synthase family O-acyltransferase [Erythrobacter sp. SCSIO 43205]UAB79467.1 wax ester/triacylglycerol synthase family O-acyltransferase [Erythrobacter sp. SCSIO 43205]